MQRIRNNFSYLDVLSKCNKDRLASIVKNADKELVLAISECILNCLNGNIKIEDGIKKKLIRHKHDLRELAKPKAKSTIKKKKRILVQSGGSILPLLLPIITQALSAILFKSE
jgi:hypothetical protein